MCCEVPLRLCIFWAIIPCLVLSNADPYFFIRFSQQICSNFVYHLSPLTTLQTFPNSAHPTPTEFLTSLFTQLSPATTSISKRRVNNRKVSPQQILTFFITFGQAIALSRSSADFFALSGHSHFVPMFWWKREKSLAPTLYLSCRSCMLYGLCCCCSRISSFISNIKRMKIEFLASCIPFVQVLRNRGSPDFFFILPTFLIILSKVKFYTIINILTINKHWKYLMSSSQICYVSMDVKISGYLETIKIHVGGELNNVSIYKLIVNLGFVQSNCDNSRLQFWWRVFVKWWNCFLYFCLGFVKMPSRFPVSYCPCVLLVLCLRFFGRWGSLKVLPPQNFSRSHLTIQLQA